jgi:hypothetical protein
LWRPRPVADALLRHDHPVVEVEGVEARSRGRSRSSPSGHHERVDRVVDELALPASSRRTRSGRSSRTRAHRAAGPAPARSHRPSATACADRRSPRSPSSGCGRRGRSGPPRVWNSRLAAVAERLEHPSDGGCGSGAAADENGSRDRRTPRTCPRSRAPGARRT